jgi:hypothetical protein
VFIRVQNAHGESGVFGGYKKRYRVSVSQSERDKWRKRLPFLLFVLVALALIIWGAIEVFNWWFNRTIGSSDDWSGIWVFGLGVVAVFYIWNLFD